MSRDSIPSFRSAHIEGWYFVSTGAGPVTHTRMCAAEFGPNAHVCTSQEVHDYAAQLTAPGGWIAATRIENGWDSVSGYQFSAGSCAAHISLSSSVRGLRLLVDEPYGGHQVTAIVQAVCTIEYPVACCSA
jgi:hypothetical protein